MKSAGERGGTPTRTNTEAGTRGTAAKPSTVAKGLTDPRATNFLLPDALHEPKSNRASILRTGAVVRTTGNHGVHAQQQCAIAFENDFVLNINIFVAQGVGAKTPTNSCAKQPTTPAPKLNYISWLYVFIYRTPPGPVR